MTISERVLWMEAIVGITVFAMIGFMIAVRL